MTMETDETESPTETGLLFQNTNLNNRAKAVFGCLDELEKKHKVFEVSRAREDREADRKLFHAGPSQEDMETISPHAEFKQPAGFSSSESDYRSSKKGGRHGYERTGDRPDFKKPSVPVVGRGRSSYRGRFGRGRGVPDHKLQPDKWTEYSLEDVDISDTSNKEAAFAFLQERKALRENETKEEIADVDSSACSKGLFTFKRPTRENSSDKSKTETSTKIDASLESEKLSLIEGGDDINDTSVDMDVTSDCGKHADEAITVQNLKRKFDDTGISNDGDEQLENSASVSGQKSVGFKSRKVSKKNIRSRKAMDDDDDNKSD